MIPIKEDIPLIFGEDFFAGKQPDKRSLRKEKPKKALSTQRKYQGKNYKL